MRRDLDDPAERAATAAASDADGGGGSSTTSRPFTILAVKPETTGATASAGGVTAHDGSATALWQEASPQVGAPTAS